MRIPREHRLGWLLSLPAVAAMAAVAAWPVLEAIRLSLYRYDLRFPDARRFVGLHNYLTVLGSPIWWHAVASTALITVASVSVELVLGMALALVMHRALVGRKTVRMAVLVPYGIITVVAALAWRFAFDPTTGFVQGLGLLDRPWLGRSWSAFLVIIATEIWKTTPFMALLLLAGLALVPQDALRAARVDGATWWQRFVHVTLPLMKPAIAVALLFRTVDAIRIFDTVFVQTRGALGTEPVSLVGYDTLLVSLNLGLGSAVSVLIFLGVIVVAAVFIKTLRVSLGATGAGGGRP
ncbi:MAG: sugar ABC transporter permease [Gemmatimonadota bacterium]|jgi:multiple sugar transport system permease protein